MRHRKECGSFGLRNGERERVCDRERKIGETVDSERLVNGNGGRCNHSPRPRIMAGVIVVCLSCGWECGCSRLRLCPATSTLESTVYGCLHAIATGCAHPLIGYKMAVYHARIQNTRRTTSILRRSRHLTNPATLKLGEIIHLGRTLKVPALTDMTGHTHLRHTRR